MKPLALLGGLSIFLFVACNNSDRIARLEKQNQELQAQIKKDHGISDFDSQSKCSRDSRTWFSQNWSREANTILLDFNNHFSASTNKCFILVEFHYSEGKSGSWVNHLSFYNVYDNAEEGGYSENHFVSTMPLGATENKVFHCEVFGQECKTIEEFNRLLVPYMRD
jgi:hypothetical protein